MKHIFLKGSSDFTLILLHGTGGDEFDLLPIANKVAKDCNILSIRGNVLEHGMPRFFKRLAPGVFDEESLQTETKNLYDFIVTSVQTYQLNPSKLIVLGYSNGANIAINVMFQYPKLFHGAILLHAMLPTNHIAVTKIDTNLFLSSGSNDPIVSNLQTQQLQNALQTIAHDITLKSYQHGHSISNEELTDVKQWLGFLLEENNNA